MPMEGGEVVWQQVGEGVCGLGGDSVDGEPSDFFGFGGSNLCAEDFGDELGSEAEAERGYTGLDGGADEVFFREQPGVVVGIVDTHGATEHDEAVDAGQVGELC